MKLELKPDRHYDRVHAWLNKTYGKAHGCEHPDCTGKSDSYHYALIKGCEHDYNILYYANMCQSCHKKYDMTDYTRYKMSESKRGSKHPKSKLTEQDVLDIREKHRGTRECSTLLAIEYEVSYHTINYIIKRRTWKHV